MNWLNSKYLNRSRICQELYGKNDPATTSKFHQKRQGKYGNLQKGFSPSELLRLQQIREELIQELTTEDKS